MLREQFGVPPDTTHGRQRNPYRLLRTAGEAAAESGHPCLVRQIDAVMSFRFDEKLWSRMKRGATHV